MGDHTNFAQEEPQDLQCLTMHLATCVVEDVSVYLDILTSEFCAIFERPSFLLECKLILRRMLVLHNRVAVQLHSLLLRPSFEMQTNPVL